MPDEVKPTQPMLPTPGIEFTVSDKEPAMVAHHINTRDGHQILVFFNRETDLLVVDLVDKGEKHGNELLRITLDYEKLLGHGERKRKVKPKGKTMTAPYLVVVGPGECEEIEVPCRYSKEGILVITPEGQELIEQTKQKYKDTHGQTKET